MKGETCFYSQQAISIQCPPRMRFQIVTECLGRCSVTRGEGIIQDRGNNRSTKERTRYFLNHDEVTLMFPVTYNLLSYIGITLLLEHTSFIMILTKNHTTQSNNNNNPPAKPVPVK